jgi:hypothetical protein
MITHSHKKLFKQLDASKIDKVQVVRNPTATVRIADSSDDCTRLKVGGDHTIVHYSKQKEKDFNVDKMNKRFRSLRRQIARSRRSTDGDEFPSPFDTLLDLGRTTITNK